MNVEEDHLPTTPHPIEKAHSVLASIMGCCSSSLEGVDMTIPAKQTFPITPGKRTTTAGDSETTPAMSSPGSATSDDELHMHSESTTQKRSLIDALNNELSPLKSSNSADEASATLIQSNLRGSAARKKYQNSFKAITILQGWARRQLAIKTVVNAMQSQPTSEDVSFVDATQSQPTSEEGSVVTKKSINEDDTDSGKNVTKPVDLSTENVDDEFYDAIQSTPEERGVGTEESINEEGGGSLESAMTEEHPAEDVASKDDEATQSQPTPEEGSVATEESSNEEGGDSLETVTKTEERPAGDASDKDDESTQSQPTPESQPTREISGSVDSEIADRGIDKQDDDSTQSQPTPESQPTREISGSVDSEIADRGIGKQNDEATQMQPTPESQPTRKISGSVDSEVADRGIGKQDDEATQSQLTPESQPTREIPASVDSEVVDCGIDKQEVPNALEKEGSQATEVSRNDAASNPEVTGECGQTWTNPRTMHMHSPGAALEPINEDIQDSNHQAEAGPGGGIKPMQTAGDEPTAADEGSTQPGETVPTSVEPSAKNDDSDGSLVNILGITAESPPGQKPDDTNKMSAPVATRSTEVTKKGSNAATKVVRKSKSLMVGFFINSVEEESEDAPTTESPNEAVAKEESQSASATNEAKSAAVFASKDTESRHDKTAKADQSNSGGATLDDATSENHDQSNSGGVTLDDATSEKHYQSNSGGVTLDDATSENHGTTVRGEITKSVQFLPDTPTARKTTKSPNVSAAKPPKSPLQSLISRFDAGGAAFQPDNSQAPIAPNLFQGRATVDSTNLAAASTNVQSIDTGDKLQAERAKLEKHMKESEEKIKELESKLEVREKQLAESERKRSDSAALVTKISETPVEPPVPTTILPAAGSVTKTPTESPSQLSQTTTPEQQQALMEESAKMLE